MDAQSAQRQASTVGRSRAQQKRSMQLKATLLSPFSAPWPRVSEEEEMLVTSLLERLCMEALSCKCGFKAVGVYGFNACVELLEAQLAEAGRRRPAGLVAAEHREKRVTPESTVSGDKATGDCDGTSDMEASSASIDGVVQGRKQEQRDMNSEQQQSERARSRRTTRGRLGGLICIRQSDENSFRAFGGQQILLLASLLRLPGIVVRQKGMQVEKAVGIPGVTFIGLFEHPNHGGIKGDRCFTSSCDGGSKTDSGEQHHSFEPESEASLNTSCLACSTHQKRLESATAALLDALNQISPPQELPFMVLQGERPGITGDEVEHGNVQLPVLFPPRMVGFPSVFHSKEGKGGRTRRQRRGDRRARRKLERSQTIEHGVEIH